MTGRAAAAHSSGGRTHRSHRLLGGDRQRGLALADGDAAEGDYASVPLNAEGRKVADTWDPSKDGRATRMVRPRLCGCPLDCASPGKRARSEIDTDAGQQTRRLLFDHRGRRLLNVAAGILARRVGAPAGRPGGAVPRWRRRLGLVKLKVVTTNDRRMAAEERRSVQRSGDGDQVPSIASGTGNSEWLVVTTAVTDPQYLTQEFVTSTHFRREPDGSKWDPTACRPSSRSYASSRSVNMPAFL